MAIYANDNYEIVSIMNTYSTFTDNNTVQWDGALMFVQGLPIDQYPYIISMTLLSGEEVVQADFDNLDRFEANVIPIINSNYMEMMLNKSSTRVTSTANSAISPISMSQNSVTT